VRDKLRWLSHYYVCAKGGDKGTQMHAPWRPWSEAGQVSSATVLCEG